jgi:selenocysteine-specific elongation factor
MYVIGTAGHVDHGKSTLIEAITGTHPDRLQEERDREMSIVLGFDSFELPDGRLISVVDVPGHRDFIENMLSGVGSIDACLLVIAADEGVMPQTQEHLDILNLLEVQNGLVALTKIDLVEDPEWLDLVELEIGELLAGTSLQGSPIVRVSARNNEGIEELLRELGKELENQKPRPDLDRPRLSVDRVFVMAGFGAVVTGTLLDGTFREGDEIELLPGGDTGRIRGLQNHSQTVAEIGPGNRVAINISGVDNKQINRGDVIAHPDSYISTRRLDVSFNYLKGVENPLLHNLECKLFLGADEALARIRVLGVDRINPGESGFLQLEVEDPVVATRGDRFILRRPSPSETLGGGVVIDPHPPKRHKRYDQEIIIRLESLSKGDPADILLQAIISAGASSWDEILSGSGLDGKTAQDNLDQLIQAGSVVKFGEKTKSIISHKDAWDGLIRNLEDRILGYHQEFPLRSGMALEELKNQSGLSESVYRELIDQLTKSGSVYQSGPEVKLASFSIQFSDQQEEEIKNLLKQFQDNPTQPPSVAECKAVVGDDVFSALVSLNKLKQISTEVVFTPDTYQDMIEKLKNKINQEGPVTVAQVRDMFGSSRKYILAFLEHLDSEGVTIREGDVRRIR